MVGLMSVEQQVRDYIVQNLLLGRESGLDSSGSLLEGGVLDSTGVLELVTFLERTFGIEVADEDLVPENLDSISNIVAFLERKEAARRAAVETDANPVN
jgi:acyl carrier protein